MDWRRTIVCMVWSFRIAVAAVLFAIIPAAAELPPIFAECSHVRLAPDAAIAACSRIIQSVPTNQHNIMLTYFNRGTAWGIKGEVDRAISDLNEAIRIENNYAPAYHNRGLALARRGEFEGALADYNQALRLNPTYLDAYASRGDIHLRQCDQVEARTDFERAIELDANFARAYVGRGASFLNSGDADRAIADATTAIRLNSSFAPAYAMRGAAYTRKRQLDPAMTDIERALALEPKLAGAYNARGSLYGIKNQVDRAIADFNLAIKIDPRFASAYTNRGFAFRQKGEIDRAVSDYNRAIELTPSCARPYNNRAYAYALKEALSLALNDANRAVALDTTLAGAYGTRGKIYLKMGNFPAAVRDLTEAVRLDPTLAEAHTDLGLTFENLGDLDRARADFKASLELPVYYASSQWVHDTAEKHLAALTQKTPAPVPAPHPMPPGPVAQIVPPPASAKSLTEAVAACNKASKDFGPFTLPGANVQIKLDACFHGIDHLNCVADALLAEAKAISQSYKEIVDPKYYGVGDVKQICRVEPQVLEDQLSRAKGFDARWETLSIQYDAATTCIDRVRDQARDVTFPDLPLGANVAQSIRDQIINAVKRVSATQKDVSDLAVEIDRSRRALSAFKQIRTGGMCPRNPT